MSIALDQIVRDLARKPSSPFTSMVYNSLCKELRPRYTDFYELKLFGDVDLSSDVVLFGLLLNSFLKHREDFPDSSVPVAIPHSKLSPHRKEVFGRMSSPRQFWSFPSPKRSKYSVSSDLPPSDPFSSENIFSEGSSLGNGQSRRLSDSLDEPARRRGGQSVRVQYQELPEEKFKEVVLDSIQDYCEKRAEELSSHCDKFMSQIRITFGLALVLFTAGVVGVLVGMVLRLVFGYMVGEIFISLGLFSEIAGVFAFYVNLDLKNKLGKYVCELNKLARLRLARLYVDQICDARKREQSLKALLAGVLDYDLAPY